MFNDRAGVLRILSALLVVAAAPAWPAGVHAQGGRFGAGGLPGTGKSSSASTPKPTPYFQPDSNVEVREVRIVGNRVVPESKVCAHN